MAKSLVTGKELDENNIFAAEAAGIGFSSEMEFDVLPPDERQEQKVAENLQKFSEKAVSEEGLDLGDLGMAARSFIDGMWFNKSEELGSSITALALTVLNPELVKGKEFSEVRREVLSAMEADTAQFEEENPWLALGSNIVGSVASPVSLLGGQVLAQAYNLKKGYDAAKVADEVAMTVSKSPMASAMYGNVAARSPEAAKLAAQYGSQQAASGIGLAPNALGKVSQTLAASRVPLVFPAAGMVGAEGAVFGYEGDSTEEKAVNAAISGGISAAIPFAWAGTKKSYDFLTKTKLAQDLGKGEDFISLMFTEHGLAPAYKYVISKAYGGFTMMEQQARRVSGLALTPAAAKETADQVRREAKESVIEAKRVIKSKTKAVEAADSARIDAKIAALEEERIVAEGAEESRIAQEIERLTAAKVDPRAAKAEAVKEADAAVAAAEGAFRGQALRKAAPPNATDDEINALGMLDPKEANEALDNLWRLHGFKAADNYNYTLDQEETLKVVDELAKKYPELSLNIPGEKSSIATSIRGYIKSQLPVDGAEITGQQLVQMRSNIGRVINSLGEKAPTARQFASEIQEHLDDVLLNKLSPEDQAAFAADRAAWSIRTLVDDSISSTSATGTKLGAFTPEDWLSSIKRFSPRFAGRAQGRLQNEAEEVYKASRMNESNILELADEEVKSAIQSLSRERAAVIAQSKSALAGLKKKFSQEQAALKAEKARLKGDARARAELDTKIAQSKAKHKENLSMIDQNRARAIRETEAIKDLMPDNFNASVFERSFNTILAGQIPALVAPKMLDSIGATLASGGILSYILSRELTQRILARQTDRQEALQKFAERNIGKADAALMGTTGGQAAGVADAVSGSGMLFPPEKKDEILNLPERVKASLYQNLKRSNRLDRVKAESPEIYRALKKAASG